jgi:methyl-accepting chemotaxis protein
MTDGASSPASHGQSGLRIKLVLAFVLPTIGIASLIMLVEQQNVRRAITSLTAEHAGAIADTVHFSAGPYVENADTADLRRVVLGLKNGRAIEYADFVDGDGNVLATTAAGAVPEELAARPLSTTTPDITQRNAAGQQVEVLIRPFYARGAVVGTKPIGYFRLDVNSSEVAGQARAFGLTNLAVVLISLLVALIPAIAVSRFVTRRILSVVAVARQVATGDLTQRSDVSSHDELGDLAAGFNAMASRLEQTLSEIVQSQSKLKSVAETVESRSKIVMTRGDDQRAVLEDAYQAIETLNGGVRKITENVESLSASSEETSSSMLEMVASIEEVSRHTESLFASVEETASATREMVSSISEVDHNVGYLERFVTETSSSMVEMEASIAQVESNAARSYDLAVAVADAAQSGMAAVRETIDGMEQIRNSVLQSNMVITRLGERSEAIGRILNVIEDIAEQTNLLALNAAILAASAGEHGRGFSVVAAEIRDLSERTARSTKEIGTLIGAVQQEVGNALRTMSDGTRLVERGVGLSHEAGRELTKILDSAMNASEMGREIAGATREQATGSDAVSRSIVRVQDMVKQINSATSQQALGSEHILKAVESMREVTRYVRHAMDEQRSGSSMISHAAEQIIDRIHEIFEVASNQATESERIVQTMEKVRTIADANRGSASEMSESLSLLREAIQTLESEVRRFRIRS